MMKQAQEITYGDLISLRGHIEPTEPGQKGLVSKVVLGDNCTHITYFYQGKRYGILVSSNERLEVLNA